MLKPVAAVAAMALSAVAFAQSSTTTTTTTSPVSQQVQLLAPQLVAFSGSTANFDSLVTGLSQGVPVTLTTVSSDGLIQIVTFMPSTTLGATDLARNLETARQALISRGIATPTAQQLAVALLGGTLATATTTAPLTGVLTGTAIPGAFQVRNELATASPLGSLTPLNLQALRTSLLQGTLSPGRRPLSDFEVNQALQLAGNLLAQQGILNPTPEQVRIALLGGTLTATNGAVVGVQGVLQGTLRNTSDSALLGTSNSPLFGTSDSPALGTSNTPATVTTTTAAPRATTTSGAAIPRSSAIGTGATPVTAAPRRGG
jgi:hypothetical protein